MGMLSAQPVGSKREATRCPFTRSPSRSTPCRTMSDSPKPPEIQLQIQLDDDMANGKYVNMALVNHTETEFTLDFIYVQPQQPRAKVLSRIITNPKHMKRLLMAIQENLAKYEQKFGPVEIIDPGTPVH
jgi:hypothetical protein